MGIGTSAMVGQSSVSVCHVCHLSADLDLVDLVGLESFLKQMMHPVDDARVTAQMASLHPALRFPMPTTLRGTSSQSEICS